MQRSQKAPYLYIVTALYKNGHWLVGSSITHANTHHV